MLTFTEMKKQAADNCGLYEDAPEMTKVIRDINTGVKRFQNAARRYWTRQEKKTNLRTNQTYYQFSSDMLRISSVKALGGGSYHPLTQVKSEDEWNRMLSASYMTNTPTHYFIKGADEVGIHPTPSGDVVDGLIVAYEPRMVDMMIDDVEVKVDVVQNDTVVTASGTATFEPKIANNCWFTTKDGSDGNWYKITKYIDNTHFWIDNNYQGADASGVNARIGQVPPFPEEYHDAPVYFASWQFFLMRKDLDSASMYKQLFTDAFNEYKTVYGNKSTGGVINPRREQSSSGNVFPGILRG